MGGKKKKTVVLDFSTSQPGPKPTEFEVEDYDYEHHQRQQNTGFDEDLEFLLAHQEPSSVNGILGKNKKNRKKSRGAVPSTTSDMSQATRDTALDLGEESQISHVKINENTKGKKSAKKDIPQRREVQRTSRKEITKDLGDIEFSSDEEFCEPQCAKTHQKEKKQKSPEPNFVAFEELEVPKPASKRNRKKKKKTEPEHVTSSTGNESEDHVGSRASSEPPQTPKIGPSLAENPSESVKKSKSKKKKKANKQKETGEKSLANAAEFPTKDAGVPDAPEKTPVLAQTPSKMPENTIVDLHQQKTSPSPSPSLSPSLKPEPEPEPTASKTSPSKATLVKQLPAVQPVSTIFGLSHDQICKIKLSDVKIKTIVNVPMSKMCKNALQFVLAETESLFLDSVKTAQFVDLCVKVALYEAPGFNEVTKRIPELLEWVPNYEPLTLSHTKTNVTLSNKQIHKNSLDYTVFSFFGHILVWASELQHAEKQESIIEKYGLGVSRHDVFNSLGGYHLWDRLRRDKTINTKRWKHIQKFRQIFAFEEHQFVLILRCLNLSVKIC